MASTYRSLPSVTFRARIPGHHSLVNSDFRPSATVIAPLLFVIFFQRLAVPGVPTVPLLIPLIYLCLAISVYRGRALICPSRLILICVSLSLLVISSILSRADVSLLSLGQLAALYLPFALFEKVSLMSYRRCLSLFSDMMALISVLVCLQYALQFTGSTEALSAMDRFFGEEHIVQGFVYTQPLYWGSAIIKPNAFVFAEVSVLSQFLAIALVIECVWLHRKLRIILLFSTLLSCFAGTGIVLLGAALPGLMLVLSARSALWLTAAVALVCGAALYLGWYEQVHQRMTEIENVDSSSYGRFVLPIIELKESFDRDDFWVTGVGAGNLKKAPRDLAYWAFVKLVREFGLLGALTFYFSLVFCVIHRSASLLLSFVCLFAFTFLGGYLHVAQIIYLLMYLCSYMRIDEGGGPFRGADTRVQFQS